MLGIDPTKGVIEAPFTLDEFETAWNDVMFGLGMRLALPPVAKLMPPGKYVKGLRVFHGFLDFYIHKAI